MTNTSAGFGRKVISGIPTTVLEFIVYTETVSGSTKTNFITSGGGATFTATSPIEVSIDGREQPLEGTHWTRTVGTQTISMSGAVQIGSIFKAKIY